MPTSEKYCSFSSQPPTSKQEEDEDNLESDKERHSSGDSALSSSPPPPSTNKTDIGSPYNVDNQHEGGRLLSETVPTRGILKTSFNRGRSYSESNATDHSRLMESASMVSVDSSIAEEQEDEDSCFINGNGEYIWKKNVQFFCLGRVWGSEGTQHP